MVADNGMPLKKLSLKSVPNSLIKYYAIGLIATLFHVVIVAVLIEKFSFDAGFANGIAFILATFFSYFMNTYWNFQTEMSFAVLCRFWSVAALGCVLAVIISSIAAKLDFHYLIGIGMVMSVVPIISYLLHRNWTYRESR